MLFKFLKRPTIRIDFNNKSIRNEEYIFCACSSFLVYKESGFDYKWKNDVFKLTKDLKSAILRNGNKFNTTERALVQFMHGTHFQEDIDDSATAFNIISEYEGEIRPFNYDMACAHNRQIFFDALNKFYYEFLIPWIAEPEWFPRKKPLYDAIDKYLIARRKEMISL